jgi:fatty acid/phospholipid biosynthesis enzyme
MYTFRGQCGGPRPVQRDKADVLVTDGFTGNVVLKVVEAFHDLLEATRSEG